MLGAIHTGRFKGMGMLNELTGKNGARSENLNP